MAEFILLAVEVAGNLITGAVAYLILDSLPAGDTRPAVCHRRHRRARRS